MNDGRCFGEQSRDGDAIAAEFDSIPQAQATQTDWTLWWWGGVGDDAFGLIFSTELSVDFP